MMCLTVVVVAILSVYCTALTTKMPFVLHHCPYVSPNPPFWVLQRLLWHEYIWWAIGLWQLSSSSLPPTPPLNLSLTCDMGVDVSILYLDGSLSQKSLHSRKKPLSLETFHLGNSIWGSLSQELLDRRKLDFVVVV